MQEQRQPAFESLGPVIRSAFASVRLSESDTVAVETHDDEGTREFFHGTHWADHGGAALEARTSCLTFFTPAAFCFFLPAFLLASTEDPDSWLASALASHLLPPKGDPSRPSFARWWSLLTDDQRRAVLAFLKLMQGRDDPTLSIDLSRLEATLHWQR